MIPEGGNPRFWVRWTGLIRDDQNKFDSTSPELRSFLRALSIEFSRHRDLNQSGAASPGDGTILLSTVVDAGDAGKAINKARKAFEKSIANAGGKSSLPNGDDTSWHAKELVRLLEAQVIELDQAA